MKQAVNYSERRESSANTECHGAVDRGFPSNEGSILCNLNIVTIRVPGSNRLANDAGPTGGTNGDAFECVRSYILAVIATPITLGV